MTDKLKIGFVLLVYPTFGTFLTEVHKAFQFCTNWKTSKRKGDGRTSCDRAQTIDWTSRTDNKVNVQQHSFDRAIQESPELLTCTQNHVWRGYTKND